MKTAPANAYALILGVSSGFGRACALSLAKEGYHIFGVHFDRAAGMKQAEDTKAAIEQEGVYAEFFNVNAADADRRAGVLQAIKTHFEGREDATVRMLVHSLAFGTLLPFVSKNDGQRVIAQRQIEMTMDVMANSLVYWTQDLFQAGLLKHGGRVLGMTSAGAHRVLPMYGAVSAAKAALESYIRQLALELGPFGITANSIRAGVTVTPALAKIPGNEQIRSNALMRNPAHRLTEPEDVARVVTMLMRDESQWINGTVIGVDGGEDAVDLTWWEVDS